MLCMLAGLHLEEKSLQCNEITACDVWDFGELGRIEYGHKYIYIPPVE